MEHRRLSDMTIRELNEAADKGLIKREIVRLRVRPVPGVGASQREIVRT